MLRENLHLPNGLRESLSWMDAFVEEGRPMRIWHHSFTDLTVMPLYRKTIAPSIVV